MSPSISEERRLGAVVDEYVHQSVHVKIRLNKSTGKFGAFLGDEEFAADALPKLKEQLKLAINEGLKLEWIPIIDLDVKPPGAESTFDSDDSPISVEVMLRAKRYYVARVQGPNWRQLAWDSLKSGASVDRQLHASKPWTPPVKDRHSHSYDTAKQKEHERRVEQDLTNWKPPFYADWKDSGYEVSVYLAYTPELWRALEEISKLLKNAQKHLAHLTATDKGIRQITLAGANLPKLLGTGE